MEKVPFIGQMDRKIQIAEKTTVRNETGEAVESLAVLSSPFAHMVDNSGDEDVEGKIRHLADRTYTIHYRADLKAKGPGLVVMDEGQNFEVYYMRELGRRERLQLQCKTSD